MQKWGMHIDEDGSTTLFSENRRRILLQDTTPIGSFISYFLPTLLTFFSKLDLLRAWIRMRGNLEFGPYVVSILYITTLKPFLVEITLIVPLMNRLVGH